jgi:FkbM family methyltransferase
MTLKQYEAFDPRFQVKLRNGGEILFCIPTRMALMRAQTLYTKEPDTIAWIDEFGPDDVFVDIGANVGIYSIYAAALAGCRVFAFEPESQNYAILNRNIVANYLWDQVRAYPLALVDRTAFDVLYLRSLRAAESHHSFGEKRDHNYRPRDFPYVQGAISMPLDDLVEGGHMPFPTRIKVDVDGLEHKVIAGARRTLADKRVHSVLIEINSRVPEHVAIVEQMASVGFDYDEGQVSAARLKSGPNEGVGNYVFRR